MEKEMFFILCLGMRGVVVFIFLYFCRIGFMLWFGELGDFSFVLYFSFVWGFFFFYSFW